MKFLRKTVFFTTIITFLVQFCSSEKILFITALGTKSHKNVFEPLIRGLGERGHKMTVIANTKSSNMGENVTEIVPLDLKNIKFPNPLEMRKRGIFSSFWDLTFVFDACEKIYQNPEFRNYMNQSYDLVIMNGFMNTCFVGYLYRLKVPYIFYSSMAAPNTITSRFGNWLPPSVVPHSFLPFSSRMTFYERIINIALDWLFLLGRDYEVAPIYEKMYRKYLGDDIPSVAEIEGNASLLFMNSYANFPTPRPTLPDVIEVGGTHARPAKPLPKDLEDFVSGAEHGFIYFSFGSIIKANDFPESTRKIFVNVFSRLKQRVLWKWDEEMNDLPPNVKLGKWLPQQDILGHKNIRLFITHGGLLSTQESIYHGVPLLGIPIFVDQDLNMNQAEQAGFALRLEILEITEQSLESQLTALLENPKISERAKYLSRAFKDQMQTPLERAIFWVEYVLRHNGASHLRSAARDLNYFQYHSVDVILFIAAVVLVIISLIILILRTVYKLLRRILSRKVPEKSNTGITKSNKNPKKTNVSSPKKTN